MSAGSAPATDLVRGLCAANQAGGFSCAVPADHPACDRAGGCGVWAAGGFAGVAPCRRLTEALWSCVVPAAACDGAGCTFGEPPA